MYAMAVENQCLYVRIIMKMKNNAHLYHKNTKYLKIEWQQFYPKKGSDFADKRTCKRVQMIKTLFNGKITGFYKKIG